jgi:hypothetical protein
MESQSIGVSPLSVCVWGGGGRRLNGGSKGSRTGNGPPVHGGRKGDPAALVVADQVRREPVLHEVLFGQVRDHLKALLVHQRPLQVPHALAPAETVEPGDVMGTITVGLEERAEPGPRGPPADQGRRREEGEWGRMVESR